MSKEATLDDMDLTPLTGLETHIPDIQSFVHDEFLVSYGVRTDDLAMVFHFFAPPGRSWNDEFRMVDRLNDVTGDHYPLDRHKVKGGFTEELDSYFVIVPGAAEAITPPLDIANKYLNAVANHVFSASS